MTELIQKEIISDDIIQQFNLNKNDQLYECFLDQKKIGYGIIRKNATDNIYLGIMKSYQNQGYGSTFFKMLISKVNHTIICEVPLNNIKMQRIVQNNHGIEIGRNDNSIHYRIN